MDYKISQKEKDDRQYHELEHRVIRPIYSFGVDADGKNVMKLVNREVSAYTRECVSGDRKMYKYFKKKFMNEDHEEILTKLPEVSELEKLATSILTDEELKPQGGQNGTNNTMATTEQEIINNQGGRNE